MPFEMAFTLVQPPGNSGLVFYRGHHSSAQKCIWKSVKWSGIMSKAHHIYYRQNKRLCYKYSSIVRWVFFPSALLSLKSCQNFCMWGFSEMPPCICCLVRCQKQAQIMRGNASPRMYTLQREQYC